jgi:hypothetical protein
LNSVADLKTVSEYVYLRLKEQTERQAVISPTYFNEYGARLAVRVTCFEFSFGSVAIPFSPIIIVSVVVSY